MGRPVEEAFPNGKPEGVDAVHYDRDEKRMLIRFACWVKEICPDVITGWNIESFDMPYLLARMDALDVDTDRMSREGYARVTKRGHARMKGHSIHDMLIAYKSTKRGELRSFSLDAVAEAELGEKKLDHSGESIYEMWCDDVDKLIRYNAKDVRLVVEIDRKSGVLDFKQALRHEIGVDLEGTTANHEFIDMMARRKLHEKGLIAPDAKHVEKDEKYEGAYVFPPYTGVAKNVVGMDLSSLYPMTMAMLNASPEMVLPPGNHEGPHSIAPNGARFSLEKDGILKELVDDAIDLKADYKELRDSYKAGTPEYEEYSEKYDVNKTKTNSVYGVSGWPRFFLYDERVAEGVTTMGQAVIKTTQKYINEHTEGQVIYGDTDSVPMNEPILIRDENGSIDIVEIQELDGRDGDVEVWTEKGFTRVKRVIRKPNRKKLYTIRTKKGVVHATEDHSLVRADGSEVEPGELQEGESLLHRNVSDASTDVQTDLSLDRAWLYGFFCGDGSSGDYAYDHPKNTDWDTRKTSWSLNNNNRELLQRAAVALSKEFGVNSRINETLESSGTYKLQPSNNGKRGAGSNGMLPSLVKHFNETCYTPSRQKRVPQDVLNGDTQAIQAFLDGYMAADGHVGSRYSKRFHEADTRHQPLASGLVFLLQRIGYTFNINVRQVERDGGVTEYYKLRCQTSHRGDPNEVKKIVDYEYDGEYVYDLETENHHFHAGAGNIIVHNSNYVKFSSDWSKAECLEKAAEIAEKLNTEVYPKLAEEHGIPAADNRWNIEVEAYMERYFQAGKKKRYAYLCTWKDGNDCDPKVSITGFTRSDISMLTKELQDEILEKILHGATEVEIGQTIYEAAQEITPTGADLERLGIPGGLSKPIENYAWTDGTPKAAHPRGCWFSNETLGTNFGSGSKPKRIYTKVYRVDGFEHEIDVLCFDEPGELPDDLVLDTQRMTNTVIVNPLGKIIEAVDVDVDAAIKNQHQVGLEAFV
ncbi:DNA polymerase domain-containing protein [Natronorubrum bangense]|uniref:DNA polymerase domain-containing protein n=1 Tax=Natronorubrum bangense TaxID=61858 RepID=UPI000A9C63D9|nr:DNA polymerase domain-containing protein [Natronorubrum bangense]